MKILVDFSYVYYRSLFAFNSLTYERDGVVYGTGTIHGVWELIDDMSHYYPESDIILCVDGKSVKQLAYQPEYKGDRNKRKGDRVELARHEIAKHFTLIPKVSIAFSPDMEADDTIGYIVQAHVFGDEEIVVYTADKDLRQLVEDGYCYCTDSVDDGGLKLEDSRDVYRKMEGLYPHGVALYLAITGDSIDSIHGIPRFNKEAARVVANEFRNPDSLLGYLQSDAVKSSKYSTHLYKLKDNFDVVVSNYKLTKIDPIAIPEFMTYAKTPDISLDWFTSYGCEKARSGIESLIKIQS